MGILSTIGSVAANALITKGAKAIGKAVAPIVTKPGTKALIGEQSPIAQTTPTNLQGGGVVPEAYNSQSNEINIQKENTKDYLLSEDYRSQQSEKLYKDKTGNSLFGLTADNFDQSTEKFVANLDKNKGLTGVSRKLAEENNQKDDAIAEITKYKDLLKEYKSPNSVVKNILKRTVGAKKYDEFDKTISKDEDKIYSIQNEDMSVVAKDYSWDTSVTRKIYGSAFFSSFLNEFDKSEIKSFNRATDYLSSKGNIEESGLALFAGELAGDLPIYAVASAVGLAAAGEGLVTTGLAANSARTVKAGMNVLKLQQTSPYLYAATFDSAFSTAAEYGMKKSQGIDMTIEDGVRSMVLGAIMPKVMGEIGEGIGKTYKYGKSALGNFLKPEDIKSLEKVLADGQTTGQTLKQAIDSNSDIKLSDGRTLGEAIASVEKRTSSKDFLPEDVQLDFSKSNVSVSSLAAKRIKTFTDGVNDSIDKGLKDSDEMALALQDVIIQLKLKQSVNSDDVAKIISEVKATHNVSVAEKEIISTSDDAVSDALHTSTFEMGKFKQAKTIQEIAEAFDGRIPVSTKDIADARTNIDVHNLNSPNDVKLLAESQGVKFDMKKAISDDNILNTSYLHSIVNDVESSVIGFAKYANKIRKEFNAKAKGEGKDIKEFGRLKLPPKEIGNEGKAIVDRLTSQVKEMFTQLKSASTLAEKNAIKSKISAVQKAKVAAQKKIDGKNATIAKRDAQIEKIKSDSKLTIAQKNEKIAEIRQSNIDKNADRRALISLTRSEIEAGANLPQYSTLTKNGKGTKSIIGKSKVTAIKDKYISRILNKTKLEDAEKIIMDFHQEMYKATYEKLTKEIGDTIAKVNKEIKGGGDKVSKIDPLYVKLMRQVANELNGTVNLSSLHDITLHLKTYEKEGRDLRLEYNTKLTKTSNNDLFEVANDLKSQGKKRFEMPGFLLKGKNTPEGGLGTSTSIVDNVVGFFEGNVQSQYQVDRIFGIGSHGAKIFNLDPMAAYSKFLSKKDYIRDNLLPNLLGAMKKNKGITGDMDSQLNKFDMWRRRNSGAHDKNLWNDVVFTKDKKGLYQYVPAIDNSKLKEGQFKLQDLAIEDREKVLGSVYKEFDNAYAIDVNFKKYEDELRAHFTNQGLSLSEKMRRLVGKEFPSIELYHPSMHRDKFNGGGATDDTLNFNQFHKDTMNDGFTNMRLPTTEKVNINTDFTSNILGHVQTATYWNEMIEPIVRMEKLKNKLRTGKIQEEFLNENEVFDMERFFKSSEGSSDSKLMSKEVEQFLTANIGKIATQGGNLRHMLEKNAFDLVSKSQSYIIPVILGGPKTAAKQLSSLADTAVLGGPKNAASGWRAMMSSKSRELALKDFGYLYERMPDWVTGEEAIKEFTTTGNQRWSTRLLASRQKFLNRTFGNLIKTTDGAASINAWFTGASKYLDEMHPELHKAGKDFDLNNIKAKLTPQEYRDMGGYAEKFMTKIMGSTHSVDQGVESGSILSKGILFLGKTGLNHTMFMFEQVANILSKNPNIGVGQRLLHTTSLAMSVSATYAYWKLLDEAFNQVDVYIGAKTQEDVDQYKSFMFRSLIKEPSFQQKMLDTTLYGLNMMFINPAIQLSLGAGYDTFIQGGKDVVNAPTLSRKAEQSTYLAAQLIGGINPFYTNVGRWMGTEFSKRNGGDMDFTKVGNKEYDKAVEGILSNMTGGKDIGFTEQVMGKTDDGVIFPKGTDLKNLVKSQIQINKSSSELNKANKAKKESKDLFIEGFKSKYGDNFSKKDFGQYIKDNKSALKELGVKKESDVISLFTAAELTRAKSQGEENSLLMGKPAQVIFDVKIKHFMESGDKEGAKAELKRLIQEGVIKNRAGAEQIAKLILSY